MWGGGRIFFWENAPCQLPTYFIIIIIIIIITIYFFYTHLYWSIFHTLHADNPEVLLLYSRIQLMTLQGHPLLAPDLKSLIWIDKSMAWSRIFC